MLEVKQQLARMTPMHVASQTLYCLKDNREDGLDLAKDLRLGNGEVLGEVRQYQRYGSLGWREGEEQAEAAAKAQAVLQLCVVVDDARACEFGHTEQATGEGEGAGQFDRNACST